ncbi:hypothetical protein L293_2409 [Acinetobacter gyllenbergii CIP 110306 = MTCC 11365]|nr:hypothetical protein L293_2409 [Acinetobacter gyllenbergii CIP 110306 = MTCC 11365]
MYKLHISLKTKKSIGFVPKRGTANAVEQCPVCLQHTDRLYSIMI